jgi:hypothetical protein
MELCKDYCEPLFHLSWENHDGEVFYPRVPSNRMVDEDDCTDRVCLSSSLHGCYTAINDTPYWFRTQIDDFIFVHVAKNLRELVETENLWLPGLDEVPDILETGEIWATGPVEMECICVARVTVGINDFFKFTPVYEYPSKTHIENFREEFKFLMNLNDDLHIKHIDDLTDFFRNEYTKEFSKL